MTIERGSVITDWNEVSRSVYSRLGEIREEMKLAKHDGADSCVIATNALDSVEQLLEAIRMDFGV